MLYLLWKWQMVEGFCNTVFANVSKCSILIFMPKLRGYGYCWFSKLLHDLWGHWRPKIENWKTYRKHFEVVFIKQNKFSSDLWGHQRPPEAKTLINSSKDEFWGCSWIPKLISNLESTAYSTSEATRGQKLLLEADAIRGRKHFFVFAELQSCSATSNSGNQTTSYPTSELPEAKTWKLLLKTFKPDFQLLCKTSVAWIEEGLFCN